MTTSITFTADQELLDMFVEAACETYGYGKGSPRERMLNPNQTKEEFAQQCVVNFCKDVVRAYQMRKAQEAAMKAATEQVDAALTATPITVNVVKADA